MGSWFWVLVVVWIAPGDEMRPGVYVAQEHRRSVSMGEGAEGALACLNAAYRLMDSAALISVDCLEGFEH